MFTQHPLRLLLFTFFVYLSPITKNGEADDAVTHQTVINGTTFQVAKGLELDLAASESLIKWPIVADWDHRGRLVVAECGGVSRPIVEHNKLGLHKIVRLIDHDNDGFFDERLIAAEGIGFPEGVLCLGNSILVAVPPQILRLTDSDGDGFCEAQEIWFDGQTITGCANDLHGPYFGRDGKIYWCKGAFAEQQHTLSDGRPFKSTAAHLYRSNEDGTQLEVVMTGGMDNPVEMAFIPEGEKFFTSTFLQQPRSGLRDGIAHAIYGGVYGKRHSVLDGHPKTGDLMPVMTQLGPAAPSGLICLNDHLLVNSDQNSTAILCSALFNLHKVSAHQLKINNATYSTTNQDLVSTARIDFHPTDVIEDADGSILILDTGGWYDLCCPTSRVDQKTASGGIYRISNVETKNRARQLPNRQQSPSKSSELSLHDPRPWVRREALRHARHGNHQVIRTAMGEIANDETSLTSKLRYVWAMCAAGTPDALRACKQLLNSKESAVLKVACHALALHKHQASRVDLEQLLEHPDAAICRVAAEAIGRLRNPESFDAILNSPHLDSNDRFVRHSLLFAMIEILQANPECDLPQESLNDPQLTALITVATQLQRVEQINRPVLFRALKSQHIELKNAATTALCENPQIARNSVEQIISIWESKDASDADRLAVFTILKSVKTDPEFLGLITHLTSEARHATPAYQRFFADHLEWIAPANPSSQWINAMTNWLKVSESSVRLKIANCLETLNLDGDDYYIQTLDSLVQSESDLRTKLALIGARPRNAGLLSTELESDLLRNLDSENASVRFLSQKAIRRIRLSDRAAMQLAQSIQNRQPQELSSVIQAIAESRDEEAARITLATLASIPIAKTLPPDFVKNVFRDARTTIKKQATTISDTLKKPDENIKQKIETLLPSLDGGNPARGLELFRSSRLACESCHKMGYRGTEIGPDLTLIGGKRTREAILESILHPSSRIEQGYETTKVLTLDGLVWNGMVVKETEDLIVLRLNADQSETILKSDIEMMEPSRTSIMPNGFAEILTQRELADLLALLTSAK